MAPGCHHHQKKVFLTTPAIGGILSQVFASQNLCLNVSLITGTLMSVNLIFFISNLSEQVVF